VDWREEKQRYMSGVSFKPDWVSGSTSSVSNPNLSILFGLRDLLNGEKSEGEKMEP
jgi:hypothetical protein